LPFVAALTVSTPNHFLSRPECYAMKVSKSAAKADCADGKSVISKALNLSAFKLCCLFIGVFLHLFIYVFISLLWCWGLKLGPYTW
jgi:hypothetical protein